MADSPRDRRLAQRAAAAGVAVIGLLWAVLIIGLTWVRATVPSGGGGAGLTASDVEGLAMVVPLTTFVAVGAALAWRVRRNPVGLGPVGLRARLRDQRPG